MRLQDWQTRLSKYVNSRMNKRFRWGSNDCIMFSVGAISSQTGIDYAKKYPKYKNEIDAYNIINEFFGGDTDNVFLSIMESHDNVKKAKVGDVIRVTFNGNKTYGIMSDDGINIWLVSEKDGIIKVNKSLGERVFCLPQ